MITLFFVLVAVRLRVLDYALNVLLRQTTFVVGDAVGVNVKSNFNLDDSASCKKKCLLAQTCQYARIKN